MGGSCRTVFCLILSLLSSPFAAAQTHKVIDLGTLGGSFSAGTAINFFGQVAGYSDVPDHSAVHAFLWEKGVGMRDLNGPPFAQSLAFGLNDLGDVVGVATVEGDHPAVHAFLWTAGRGMQDLGSLDGQSTAYAINDFRQVVGDSEIGQGGDDAFLLSKASGMRDLGRLAEGISLALAINNLGQVVGGSSAPDGFHAFLWEKLSGMKDLGTLGGCESEAAAISDGGMVTGGSITTGCDPSSRHAFLWTQDTGMRDLGAPSGRSFGGPGAINSYGQIVGAACVIPCLSQESVHAFSWTESTGWVDLNDIVSADSGWVLENTQSINASGQITGQGFINGEYHAFFLKASLGSRPQTLSDFSVLRLSPRAASR